LVNEFRLGKRYNLVFGVMKQQIPIRIKVLRPLAGVRMMVQRGKDELLPPSETSSEALVFDFEVSVDLSEAIPNFLGKYAHGPKNDRFLYVNSGQYADQHTHWARRAKISLVTVTREQIEAVLAETGSVLQTEFEGIGRDGGPTCASVKGIKWTVAAK
jgi:hypothetical protein